MQDWLKKVTPLQVAVALVVMIPATVILWRLGDRWWALLVLVPTMLLGFHYRDKLRAEWRAALVGLMCAVIIVSGLQDVQIMRSNIADPPEWDFLAFWVEGRVAAQGVNFYDAANYQRLTLPIVSDSDFAQEVLNIGFTYPPPTILIFVPLGWFDIRVALFLWYAINGLILILTIGLLWRTFLKNSGGMGLALAAALLLILKPTLTTISVGQTNFMVLLTLILFWRDRERGRGGIWLAIGIVVKPLVAFLLLYVLLRRLWRTVIFTAVGLAVLSLFTLLFFGPTTFFSYLTLNPTSRLPGYIYTEATNQSLLATILRLTGYDFSGRSPLTQPLFVGIALVLTLITALLVYRSDALRARWSLALMILLALMVYPATLDHYGVTLILIFCVLWESRQALMERLGIWGVVGAVAFITLECIIINGGGSMFVAIALCWLVFSGITVWITSQKPVQAKVVAPSPGV